MFAAFVVFVVCVAFTCLLACFCLCDCVSVLMCEATQSKRKHVYGVNRIGAMSHSMLFEGKGGFLCKGVAEVSRSGALGL